MLDAKALLYAIMVMLLIAVLSSSLILLAQTRRGQQDINFLQTQLLRNVTSGLEILKSDFPIPAVGTTIDLFGEGTDSVFLEKKYWGMYRLARVTAFASAYRQDRAETKIALLGSLPDKDLALYLADNNRPLGLCGKTEIKGTAYLPKGGAKRAYINGQSYIGDRLIYGAEKRSTTSLAPIDEAPFEALLAMIDSIPSSDQIGQESSNSFLFPTIHLRSSSMDLSGYSLSGNILISAEDAVVIGVDTELDGVLVCAPKIIIKDGFEGNLQAVAFDSLAIGADVRLNYPSIIGIYNQENNVKMDELNIQEQAHIEGFVFLHDKALTGKKGMITIGKGAVLDGNLYAQAKVQLEGSVLGSVTCKGFYLKTAASIYDNHLLNAKIAPKERNRYHLSPTLNPKQKNTAILKWLN